METLEGVFENLSIHLNHHLYIAPVCINDQQMEAWTIHFAVLYYHPNNFQVYMYCTL